jgi:hypothetical protein
MKTKRPYKIRLLWGNPSILNDAVLQDTKKTGIDGSATRNCMRIHAKNIGIAHLTLSTRIYSPSMQQL